MTERPILFSAPMVRAILNGTKTQTRRVVKADFMHDPQGSTDAKWYFRGKRSACWDSYETLPELVARHSPYGKQGDRLWVRETWAYGTHALSSSNHEKEGPWVYASDNPDANGRLCDRWRPSIHMFRAASRITLEITGVRVERLQDISEADAIAEGIERAEDFFGCPCWKCYGEDADAVAPDDPVGSYQSLWNSINGDDAWAANPWVWVVEFKAV